MVHLFIFHRDLRLYDNTTLIHLIKETQNVIPIFIFTPEQINPKKNKYFSNNSVQFMIESLHELSDNINEYKGKMYFFKGDNIKVIKSIHKLVGIQSIGFNIDYTPYAIKRDNEIKEFCQNNNINCYFKEDYPLYDILDKKTNKVDGTPYLVYTPFLKHLTSTIDVRNIDKFNKFNFQKKKELESLKYFLDEKEIDNFYQENKDINVHGGRSHCSKILSNIDDFKDYNKKRDFLVYKTTFLSAGLHFNVVSIREVYHKVYSVLGPSSGILRELVFRDFYMNIVYNFPHILQGQIKGKNISYKKEFDNIKWSYNKNKFEKFCQGQTGFPIVDACIRQLLKTGYMVNRGRMVVASFLTKDLHIDWRWGEQFFANHLVDYDPINNSQGWMWTTGNGTDAQPWFRIFNPWTQQKNYDKDCEYILKWIPELANVPIKDIHNWFKPDVNIKYKEINYPPPMINHDEERLETLRLYKEGLK
jgi:deoxyribodipyrimidine photo-lyase